MDVRSAGFAMSASLCAALLLTAPPWRLARSEAAPHTPRPEARQRVGAQQPPTRDLVLDQEIEATLAPGEAHAYRFTATAGDFVEIQVAQRGVDVAVAVVGPDGQELVAVDAMDDEFRPETVMAVATADGWHDLRVSVTTRGVASGRYGVRLRRRAPATDIDLMRVEAERWFARGRKVRDAARSATWPEALSAFEAALARYRQLDARDGELKALIEVAVTRYYMSSLDALDAARQGVRLARELKDAAALARVLRSLGNQLVARGELNEAVELLTESAGLSERLGSQSGAARALNDAGIAYRRLGMAEQAVAHYERALPLARATREGSLEANILNNLGVAYRSLGEDDRALEIYQAVLANRRAAGDRRAQVVPLTNVGNALGRAGRYREALGFHLEALEVVREIGDRMREVEALGSLAGTYQGLGEYTTAVTHYRAGLELARATAYAAEEGEILFGLGQALRSLGRFEEARQTLEAAMPISQSTNPYVFRDLLTELADIARAGGDLAQAERHITDAVDLDERLRTAITSPDLRASFVAARQDTYERLIAILQQRHLREPAAGFESRALHVSERARARVLLDSLLDGHVDLRAGVDPALLARERALQRTLNAASARLSRAVLDQKPEAEQAAAQEVARATAEYEQLQRELRRESPQYAAVTRPEPLAPAAIQRDVLDQGTVLLEFALGEEASWLFAVTPHAVTTVQLPPRADIERAARSVYEHLTARQRRPGESTAGFARRIEAADRALSRESTALSELLLAGIAARLQQEWRGLRLAIVGGGALEYVPFGALPLPQDAAGGATPPRTPRRLLGDAHEIVYLPSASVLPLLRTQASTRKGTGRRIAILADPVYERADPRVARIGSGATPAATVTSPILARQAIARSGPGRLPFSRAEARDIAALLPPGTVSLATDFEASRATALGPAVRDARIVHFATHGVLDAQRPAFSGLVLSLLDASGAPQNGYLRLHDIYNLRLTADLVVLSACQTALGEEIRGEGLVGLARAFMYAGAPRVVASLWQVNDQATAALMKAFYTGLLRDGLAPAAALTAAQRQLRADPRWRAPYYWAGFILLGDWR